MIYNSWGSPPFYFFLWCLWQSMLCILLSAEEWINFKVKIKLKPKLFILLNFSPILRGAQQKGRYLTKVTMGFLEHNGTQLSWGAKAESHWKKNKLALLLKKKIIYIYTHTHKIWFYCSHWRTLLRVLVLTAVMQRYKYTVVYYNICFSMSQSQNSLKLYEVFIFSPVFQDRKH